MTNENEKIGITPEEVKKHDELKEFIDKLDTLSEIELYRLFFAYEKEGQQMQKEANDAVQALNVNLGEHYKKRNAILDKIQHLNP